MGCSPRPTPYCQSLTSVEDFNPFVLKVMTIKEGLTLAILLLVFYKYFIIFSSVPPSLTFVFGSMYVCVYHGVMIHFLFQLDWAKG